MNPFADYLLYWRTTIARDREIIEAVVHPDHVGPSRELATALDEWPGLHYWATHADSDRLVLIRILAPARRERWALHLLLFLGTFLTAWMAGAVLLGVSTKTWQWFEGNLQAIGTLAVDWAQASAGALSFAMAMMGILLTHEMGHYLAARRYGIDASPPYFLPAPIELNFIGTFGAFIRLRTPVIDRRQLMDIGAAGPWAGFVVALIVLAVGLQHSTVLPDAQPLGPMIIEWRGGEIGVGDSLLTLWLRPLIAGTGTTVLDPLAVAGWAGLLVTALNLLPLGQLDGGHILYALVGDRQRYVAILAWLGLVVLGWWFKPWWIWAALVLVLGAGKLAHPKVLEHRRPLPRGRQPTGWASVALFVVTFAPVPIL